jgi:hypothetical protein
MGGLLVLALIAGYIWGAAKLFKRVGPYWAKALVVIAAILLPTADAVYGRIKLKQMCEAEGGLHIYRVVEGGEGFDDPRTAPYDDWITKYGYRVVEGDELNGKESRLSLLPDGSILRETGISPSSKYIYELDKGDYRDTYHRIESRVRVRDSGEVLSRAINIRYAGGWFERFVGGLYASTGNAGSCGPIIYSDELITKTLKPIKRENAK